MKRWLIRRLIPADVLAFLYDLLDVNDDVETLADYGVSPETQARAWDLFHRPKGR